jgi:hypothetical protein
MRRGLGAVLGLVKGIVQCDRRLAQPWAARTERFSQGGGL